MNVLILKNVPHEGPGTIQDFLKGSGIQFCTVELSMTLKTPKGEVPDTSPFTHLVMMGGPMAVYEMEKYDFLKTGTALIEEFIKKDKGVLGVCLGAQVMAHVLGGTVYAGTGKEIGWYKVDITPEGLSDSIMKTLAIENSKKAQVFQWHGDTFTLPKDAVRLASSRLYPNQAFRWGKKAYALQFHIEVTPEIIADWFKDDPQKEKMVRETEEIYSAYSARAFAFYREFFK